MNGHQLRGDWNIVFTSKTGIRLVGHVANLELDEPAKPAFDLDKACTDALSRLTRAINGATAYHREVIARAFEVTHAGIELRHDEQVVEHRSRLSRAGFWYTGKVSFPSERGSWFTAQPKRYSGYTCGGIVTTKPCPIHEPLRHGEFYVDLTNKMSPDEVAELGKAIRESQGHMQLLKGGIQ